MKNKILKKIIRSLVLQGLVILALASAAMADYELVWDNVQAGGESSGGGYLVSGTIESASYGVSGSDGYYLNHGVRPGNIGCEIDMSDLSAMAVVWLSDDRVGDFDDDGYVGMSDFSFVAGWWLETCPMD